MNLKNYFLSLEVDQKINLAMESVQFMDTGVISLNSTLRFHTSIFFQKSIEEVSGSEIAAFSQIVLVEFTKASLKNISYLSSIV